MQVKLRCNCEMYWEIDSSSRYLKSFMKGKKKEAKPEECRSISCHLKTRHIKFGNLVFQSSSLDSEGYLICFSCGLCFMSSEELELLSNIAKYSNDLMHDFICYIVTVRKKNLCITV